MNGQGQEGRGRAKGAGGGRGARARPGRGRRLFSGSAPKNVVEHARSCNCNFWFSFFSLVCLFCASVFPRLVFKVGIYFFGFFLAFFNAHLFILLDNYLNY